MRAAPHHIGRAEDHVVTCGFRSFRRLHRLRKFRNQRAAIAPDHPIFFRVIVVTAKTDSSRAKGRCQLVEGCGHLWSSGMHVLEHLPVHLRVAPCLERLTGEPRWLLALCEAFMREVIVEDHIGHLPLCDLRRQIVVGLQKVDFKTQLRDQIRHHSRARGLDPLKHLGGELRTAQTALP